MSPLTTARKIALRGTLAAALALTWGQAAVAASARWLSPQEVSQTFIGTPWHSEHGAFLFREDGTYSYWEFGKNSPRGTWRYDMLGNGALEGGSTRYRFFRTDEGRYFYHHSRSDANYPAFPDKSFP